MPRKVYTAIILLKNSFAIEYISIILGKNGVKLLAKPKNAGQAIMLIEQQNPDIFICEDDFDNTEITLPKLKDSKYSTKVILIVNNSKIDEIIEYFKQGVLSVLRIDSPANELSDAIKAVQKNQIFVSNIYQKHLPSQMVDINYPYHSLSKREKEIMRSIAEGHTNIQIADKLNISPNSVNNHRANIRKKLNLKGGKSELLQVAISKNRDYFG